MCSALGQDVILDLADFGAIQIWYIYFIYLLFITSLPY